MIQENFRAIDRIDARELELRSSTSDKVEKKKSSIKSMWSKSARNLASDISFDENNLKWMMLISSHQYYYKVKKRRKRQNVNVELRECRLINCRLHFLLSLQTYKRVLEVSRKLDLKKNCILCLWIYFRETLTIAIVKARKTRRSYRKNRWNWWN